MLISEYESAGELWSNHHISSENLRANTTISSGYSYIQRMRQYLQHYLRGLGRLEGDFELRILVALIIDLFEC